MISPFYFLFVIFLGVTVFYNSSLLDNITFCLITFLTDILILIRNKRTKDDPSTPPKQFKYSRRAFDGLVKLWRKKLHWFDPPNYNKKKENPDHCESADDKDYMNHYYSFAVSHLCYLHLTESK